MDAATRSRVKLVCSFINAEVARVRNRTIAIGVACIVGIVLVPFVVPFFDARIPFILSGGIFAFFYVRARTELSSSYRDVAVKRLVAALGRRLTYKPASALTREQFLSLDLFPVVGDGWKSVHTIGGGAPGASYSLHQVEAAGVARGSVAFRGAVVRVDVSRSFPGHTIVVPEHDGIAGGVSRVKRDIVMLKNPTFERMFGVYSTDYAQARGAITPRLMAVIMRATETFGTDLRLALVNRSLYLALPDDALLPEVGLLTPPFTPESAAGALARAVALAEELTNALAPASSQLEIVS